MFETDAHLWLQTFDAPWLLAFMTLVSTLGTFDFYMAAFLLLAFGVKLRPTLGVLTASVLAGTITGIAKLGFGLPRPSEVDARVLDKGESGHALVTDGAADSFWALPSDDAIETVRAAGEMDYGFISGHSSTAMAFALGLALFFGARRRWVFGIALGWALLMGISRMYLGRHFLADVLGGWVVGALAVWLAWLFVRAIHSESPAPRRRAWSIAITCVAVLFLLSLRLPFVTPDAAGQLAGVLVCLFLASRISQLDESGIGRRVLRVLLAFVMGYGVNALLKSASQAAGWNDAHPMAFVLTALGFTLAIFGTFYVAKMLRLYRQASLPD
ncbi:MAG: phosphatase PAP2 family protein [Thermomonas sp.]|uniref:phosphatase PAP2 family protein n=1 Tax=Thermomonas sp. TaxID=1971895 RepID=UPI0039E364BD